MSFSEYMAAVSGGDDTASLTSRGRYGALTDCREPMWCSWIGLGCSAKIWRS